MSRSIVAAGMAAALALAAAMPANAMPLTAGAAALKSAPGSGVIDVRWRGRGFVYGGIGAGLALGAIAASRPYYYGAGPYYAAPYYAAPPAVVYDDEPVYAVPDAGPSYYNYGYNSNYSGPVRERQLNGRDY